MAGGEFCTFRPSTLARFFKTFLFEECRQVRYVGAITLFCDPQTKSPSKMDLTQLFYCYQLSTGEGLFAALRARGSSKFSGLI